MPTKSKRRWRTFSIQTLFALVVLFVVVAPSWWLIRQFQILEERMAVRQLIEARGGYLVPSTTNNVTLIRRFFGDDHMILVSCFAMSADEIQRAKQAYPEASFQ